MKIDIKFRNIIIITCGIIVVSLISLNFYPQPQSTDDVLPHLEAPRNKCKYEAVMNIECQFNGSIPNRIMIYKSDPITTEDLIEQLEHFRTIFGVNGTITESTYCFEIRAGNQEVLSCKDNNKVIYYLNDYDSPDPFKDYNLPSISDIKQSTLSFLKNNNILPELESFENYEIYYRYGIISAYQHPANNCSISIYLNRYIDGYKVSGNGGYCRLTFGENETIISCLKEWRPYIPYKEYSLYPKSVIIEKLEEKGVWVRNISIGNIKNAIITNISIQYYQDCHDLSTPYYLQPLFLVEGYAIGEHGTDTFSEYVEAVQY